jgi:hypothetical protein
MKQHSIQKAYLKNFCVNGKLWVHEKSSKKSFSKLASKCTIEENFQSPEIEYIQNKLIENPGIKAINKLRMNKMLELSDYKYLLYWSSLHIIRSEKYRNTPEIKLNYNYQELIDTEIKFCEYFTFYLRFNCGPGNFFLTSDDPIIELIINKSILRLFPISPSELSVFSSVEQDIIFPGSVVELINSTIWLKAYKHVFSNQRVLPYLSYEANIIKYKINEFLVHQIYGLKKK